MAKTRQDIEQCQTEAEIICQSIRVRARHKHNWADNIPQKRWG
jgi:hypothetical protein